MPFSAQNNRRRVPTSGAGSSLVALFLLFLVFAAGCVSTPKRVVLLVDGGRRVVDTWAVTVQDVLREQNIKLGDNDRVDPPPYAVVDKSATITVTRVRIETVVAEQAIPFERKIVRDETFPEGRMKVLQLGSNGTSDITYTVTFENGKEIARRETARHITSQPKNEVLAVGTLGSLPAVPLDGSVVYLANGNAWVMRNSSSDKRPLTATGDLDGRVFSLSADGRYLLFTRAADDASKALNTLWLIDTLVLGETARPVSVGDVLYAQLAPDARAVAYSTGEKTAGAPGWKAHNDFWIAPLMTSEISATQPATLTLKARAVWTPSIPAPYGWWGANFAWAPDGRALAYAFANEIGFSEIPSATEYSSTSAAPRQSLASFAPFRTRADWVWVPQVMWSPDSRFVIGAVHAPLDPTNVANDNPLFEVWAFARNGSVKAPLAKQTGMWAAPNWSPPDARGESRIAYGVALSPSDSERSRYALYLMDRDGANKRQIFPTGLEDGLTVVRIAWSPSAQQLIAVRDNDLWLYDLASDHWSQLTANDATSLVCWSK